MPCINFTASFLAFAALVLQLFTIIGNTFNKDFLRSLYFTQIVIDNATFVDFGLWNFCEGTIRDGIYNVTNCGNRTAAFNWANSTLDGAPLSENLLKGFPISDTVFLANFILYFIAFGFTFIAIFAPIVAHYKGGYDFLASFLTLLACGVMFVVFVIVLVISTQTNNTANGQSQNSAVSTHLGPSTWMTVGAAIALIISSLAYLIACCCAPFRRRAPPQVA